jgi:hypothetical protein
MLQLTPRGAVVTGSDEAQRALRDEFQRRRCVKLTGLLEGPLLSQVQKQVGGASFHERTHHRIATELCMDGNACLGLLHFLVNDPAVLRFVEGITGTQRLTSFVGRVYRMLPGGRHFDSWHSDELDGREIGMSLNLSESSYEGGVFEIRARDSGRTIAALPNVGFGDAILFAIDGALQHRVTPVEGATAKTAFAGWFGAAQAYQVPR